MPQEERAASALTGISGAAGFISLVDAQLYVSITAGFIGIVSGICAIFYYIKKIKEK